jgi:O-acetyl-ADP-ribose deacetylase (regulator of RNase III)
VSIELTCGDLLRADVEALVNPVNCVGVMGRGLAAQFKRAFPENFRAYRDACGRRQIAPGKLLVVETGAPMPRYVVNFPTKRHWRDRSRLEDVEAGLDALTGAIRKHEIRSLAVPPLGCGLGGLDWDDVRSRIERALGDLRRARVLLFTPT